MSNFGYLNWLSGIIKKASDIPARQKKYSNITGKKFNLSSKDIRTLTGLKKQLEKTQPFSPVKEQELKSQLSKINTTFQTTLKNRINTKQNNINLSVLRDLTSGVYEANPGRSVIGWRKPVTKWERMRWGRRGAPIWGPVVNYGSIFNDIPGEGSSSLERLLSFHSLSKWVERPTAEGYRQTHTQTKFKFLEKNKALNIINSAKQRKYAGVKYTQDQINYLNKVLTNPVLEKYLYTGTNTKYLKVGMLHQAVGLLLDPNAPSDIKNSGIWIGKGGSKTSFLGGVYQVNPFSLYVNDYKNTFFEQNPDYKNIGSIAQKEQVLLESFLKKGNKLSGIDFTEYNKWIAESTKQQKLIESSLNEYLKTGGAKVSAQQTSTATWADYSTNKNYLNTAYGSIDGFYGKITGIKNPSKTYSGYVDRAKNHAVLYSKAQEAAYLALQKSLATQEKTTRTVLQAREGALSTISNLTKLTEQNKIKTVSGKTLEQIKTEALKKRLSNKSNLSSYKNITKTTQRPL